jgi:TonB family protein
MRRQFALAVLAAFAALPAQAIADAPVQNPPSHGCLDHYPKDAKDAGIEGMTTLAFTVTEQGMVAGVRIAKSSGNADLDNAAAACASLWRYEPARKDSKPVATPWQATVQWKLH